MNVSDCLSPLVGIRGTDCDGNPLKTTTANLYVNDLPGITVRLADNVSNEEQKTGVTLMTRAIDTAAQILATDIQTRLGQLMSGRTIIENGLAGYFQDNPQSLSGAAKYRGVMIRVATRDYLSLAINSISFWSETTGSVDFLIVDGLTGEALKTVTQSVTEGEIVTIPVGESYFTRGREAYFGVVYDATGIDSRKTNLYRQRGGCADCTTEAFLGNGTWVSSGEWTLGTDVTYASRSATTSSSGLSVDYSLDCSAESFLCSNARLFATALWYGTAVQILEEATLSKRLNAYVTVYSEDNQGQHQFFSEKYNKLVDHLLSNVNLNDSICNSCRATVRSRVRIP